MAKTESTAVNELIDLVQGNKQPAAEPAADLFAAPAPASIRVHPSRITSPVPALRGAGEVEPLPRGRAPHSTSEQPMHAVRMSTADPERGNTIPPLARPTPPRSSAAALPPPRKTPRSTGAVPALASEVPAVPPPRKTPRSTGAVPALPPRKTPRSTGAVAEHRAPEELPALRPSQLDTLQPASEVQTLRPSSEMRRRRTSSEMQARSPSSEMHAQRPSSEMEAQRAPALPPPRPSSAPPIPTQRPSAPPIPQRAASAPPIPQRATSTPPIPAQRASSPPPPRQATQMPAQRAPSPSPSARDELSPLSASGDANAVDIDMTPLPPPYDDFSPLPISPLPTSPLPTSPLSHASLPIQQRPTVPTLPPLTAPVAAPFDNPLTARPTTPQMYPVAPRPKTSDVVRGDQWLEISAPVPKLFGKSDRSEGTAVVVRQRGSETFALVKKLIAPTIILAIIGVMVGGYFAFDGQGGKKKQAQAATAVTMSESQESTRVAMPVVPSAASDMPAVAQPEPPTKAEQVAKAEAATGDSMFPAATTAAITPNTAPAVAPAAAPAPAPAPAAAPAAGSPARAAAPAPAAPAPVAARATPAAAAPAVVAAPAKAITTSATPAPIREVQTTRGVVKLVDVRIDSKPSGATVMLVDKGKTSFLGSTPLATSLDPSRTYDVIFTLPGRPTQMAPLDPAKSAKLEVSLARGTSERTAKKQPSTAKLGNDFIEESAAAKKTEKKASEPKLEKAAEPKVEKTAEPKPDKAVVEPKTDKKAEPAGEGTLMVSSKPPCEIIIDGKPTGLTTPQRSISLPAGTHKVTFVNATEGIKKTVSVTITADQSTKLIQDLMKK